ncbi:MAG: hypothetical protein MI742_04220 [Desulfobacterales bacterium]|nr:hypothetical protein [Desulfobacterales bacterium]
MFNSDDICSRIRHFYPDSGECGKDLKICYSEKERAWVVETTAWKRKLHTYLDQDEVDLCLSKGHCVGLSFQMGQLRANAGGGREV